VPLNKPLTVTGMNKALRAEAHQRSEISNEAGVILARSTGTFIAIDPAKMFSKFIDA